MRHIAKSSGAQGPYCLTQKLAQGAPSDPTKAWDNFYSACKEKLINGYFGPEQYELCAYTELRLDELGCHIEHIKPKSRYPQHTFDYQNLVASCVNSSQLQESSYADRFGGHFKCGDIRRGETDKYHPDLFISPLEPDCRRYFSYETGGQVIPASNLSPVEAQRAQYTIAALNLNAPHLKQERLKVITEMLPEIDKLLDTPEALRHFAEADLCVTGGRLNPFHSARLQQFGALGRRVIVESGCIAPSSQRFSKRRRGQGTGSLNKAL